MTRRLTHNTTLLSEQDLPKPGEVLGGKYEVIREIGRGGMGVVYEVKHAVMTQSHFAIKWLVAQPEHSLESQRRFKREARVCGAVRHPNVVEVYDVNIEDGGVAYMVMQLLRGESLAARLAREGALPVAEACRIFSAALAGVAAAHTTGVIHRDLKPGNIFLCEAGPSGEAQTKVLDFGISRVMPIPGMRETTEKTRKGTLIGTPAYMAPEQLRAADCDQRTDVYALGVALYEALSGGHPFRAVTEPELVHKILAGEATPLRTLLPELPPGLSESVAKAMHLAPEQRYESADAFAAVLAPFAQVAAPGRRTPPRAWLTPVAALLGSAAAIGVALWAVSSGPKTEPPAPTLREETQVAPAQQLKTEVQPAVLPAQPQVAAPSAALDASTQPPRSDPQRPIAAERPTQQGSGPASSAQRESSARRLLMRERTGPLGKQPAAPQEAQPQRATSPVLIAPTNAPTQKPVINDLHGF